MGHVDGKGLGKHAQGRAEIVEASKQKGRRGLGMMVKGFQPQDVEWDASKEEVSQLHGVHQISLFKMSGHLWLGGRFG